MVLQAKVEPKIILFTEGNNKTILTAVKKIIKEKIAFPLLVGDKNKIEKVLGKPGRYGWTTGEPTNTVEFKARMQELINALTWEDVLGQVPDISESVEIVDLSRKDRIKLGNLVNVVGKASRSITQIGRDARVRAALGELKVKVAVDCAKRFLDSDESVVIWTWHRAAADEICNKLNTINSTM